MPSAIIFPNEQGGVAVCYPNIDSPIPVEEVARKDVPAGLPFLVVDVADIPQDRTFRDAWTADFSQPAGYGIGHRAWFLQAYQTEIDALQAAPAPAAQPGETDQEHQQAVTALELERDRRIAALNQQIAALEEQAP